MIENPSDKCFICGGEEYKENDPIYLCMECETCQYEDHLGRIVVSPPISVAGLKACTFDRESVLFFAELAYWRKVMGYA